MDLFDATNATFRYVNIIDEPEPVLSDEIRRWADTLLNLSTIFFCMMGAITNGINIRVFIQQGVTSDSNTVCLFALALVDFLGCLFLLPHPFCDILKYTSVSAATVNNCYFLTFFHGSIPHDTTNRINCWITVYIAIERCLCVLIPFKVKLLLRPKVAAVAMILIYLTFIGVYTLVFCNIFISWNFDPRFNESVAIIGETAIGIFLMKYLTLILNTILPSIAFVIITIATSLMLYKLNNYKKWRKKSASATKGANTNTAPQKRDVEILKMVLMVTSLFLACLAMSLFPGIAPMFVTGFSHTGHNQNLFYTMYTYRFLFDVVNSSLNFFFYFRISSRYKAAFNKAFGRVDAN